MKKSTKIVLIVSLCLCIISSVFASGFQRSWGKVQVEDFNIPTADGNYVAGEIYIPEGASAENKLPLIITQHGSYNNSDHQDQNAIELSKRGYVVIMPDAYNHGSSSVIEGTTNMFEVLGDMKDLLEYAVATLDYIDTDKIGITGHSMGGMISSQTLVQYLADDSDIQIAAILNVGYDMSYHFSDEQLADPATYNTLDLDMGFVAAKYDEWFYRGDTGDPADFLTSTRAKNFVNELEGVNVTDAVENAKVYTGTINGEEYVRFVAQSNEIHPLNHFSKESAAYEIEFFYAALGTPAGYEVIDSSSQTWQYKEFFNFVGLIGIFLFLFSFASLLIHRTDFFRELAGTEPAPLALTSGKAKAVHWTTYAINTIFPCLLVMPIMLHWIGKDGDVPWTYNSWFGEPNSNELGTWTAIVGILLLAVFLIARLIAKGKGEPFVPDAWGVKASAKNIGKSCLLALTVVGVAYVILFTSDLLFNVDYRLWVVDMRVFTADKVLLFLAYFPAWVIFYTVNSILVNGGNRVEGRPEWLTLLLSCISNILGIVVLIFIQYYGIIANGTFTFNSMRIVNLFPLVVLIPVGTLISRRFFKETGNVYAGSFTVAFLYTMMTVANTIVLGSVIA